MKTYNGKNVFTFERTQMINSSIDDVWKFFSSPYNLQKITPDNLDFKILECPDTKNIFDGMTIKYRVKPLLNIPVIWITKIQNVNPPYGFSDIQTKGPYKYWEHFHTFRETDGGIIMTDIIKYSLHFGVLSSVANKLVVEKKIGSIFNYRKRVIEKIFMLTNE